jgi:hypothetical protein
MSGTVLLNDVIDALEMQFDESSFLDLDTGRDQGHADQETSAGPPS